MSCIAIHTPFRLACSVAAMWWGAPGWYSGRCRGAGGGWAPHHPAAWRVTGRTVSGNRAFRRQRHRQIVEEKDADSFELKTDDNLKILRWNDSRWRREDALAYLAELKLEKLEGYSRSPSTYWVFELGQAIIASLAMWDWDLCRYLAREATLEDLLQAEELLLGHPEYRSAPESGLAEKFPPRQFDHSPCCQHSLVSAASSNFSVLHLRIWQAEISVLMPLIENIRPNLITCFLRSLPVPYLNNYGVSVTDVNDLEIGVIFYLLGKALSRNGKEYSLIRILCEIRNALAHRTCPPREHILTLATLAKDNNFSPLLPFVKNPPQTITFNLLFGRSKIFSRMYS